MRRITFVVFLFILFVPGPAYAQLTAGFASSNDSGTAPLYVFFDGTTDGGMAHTDADVNEFTNLFCEWDFGDSSSGTWDTDGASKNYAIGCIAAHVYESAGSYTVTLSVRDEAGNTDTATDEITVTDPGTTWSGTSTVCIAQSSTPVAGSGGCPSGASVAQNSDFDNALSTDCDVNGNSATLRCLFNGGDTFTSSGAVSLADGPMMISSYGTGKAIIDATGFTGDDDVFFLGSGGGSASDIRITDFIINGPTSVDGAGLSVATTSTAAGADVRHVLFSGIEADEFSQFCVCLTGTGVVNDRFGLVDLVIDNPDIRSIGFFSQTRTALMGIDSQNTDGIEPASGHARTFFSRKILWEHNRFTGNSGNTVNHQAGNAAGATSAEVPDVEDQSFLLVSDNYAEIDTSSGGVQGFWGGFNLGETSDFTSFIWERNFVRITTTDDGFIADIEGVDMVIRNNVVDAGPRTTAGNIIGIGSSDSPQVSDNWQVTGNTLYTTDSTAAVAIQLNEGNNAIVRNNLYYTPNDTSTTDIVDDNATGTTSSNNLQFDDADQFLDDGTFDESDDFKLDPVGSIASSLIEAGFDFLSADEDGQALYIDFGSNCRPADDSTVGGSGFDLGAWESEATQSCLNLPTDPQAIFGGSLGGGIQ